MKSVFNSWVLALAGAVVLGAAGCATTTSDPSNSTAQAQDAEANKQNVADKNKDAADNDAEKKICKRIESTGSNFARKKCQTRAEWEAESKAARDALDRLDRKNREGCTIAQQC